MKKKKVTPKSFRIAAYVRVSTEEQAANPEGSVKNQEQRIREYVRHRNMDSDFGEIIEVFCDPGISAKNMNRPELQRMLEQVSEGEINLVIVTDLSRLTRSTKDFALLWDFLREHGCKFQSLREAFDTTTAAGEMIMFTLANFAQFERKQTGERIAHSFLARSKRELYNGGAVPLGYRIDDSKPGHLVVVEKEAEIVRLIFKTYLEEQSLAQTAKRINDMSVALPKTRAAAGISRGEFFRAQMIHGVLRLKSYTGIRVYKVGDKFEEVKAAWDPIIDDVSFARAQKLLKGNKSHKKPPHPKRFLFQLSSLCFCAKCGDRMSGKTAHGTGGKFAYYEHARQTKANASLGQKIYDCSPARVQVSRIEPVVWDHVKRFLVDKNVAKELLDEAQSLWHESLKENPEEKLKKKLSGVKSQIAALAERIGQLPIGIDASPLITQLGKIQAVKADLESQLLTVKVEADPLDEPIGFSDFEVFRLQVVRALNRVLDPEEQSKIIAKVVQKILIYDDGIEIFFHVGRSYYLSELEMLGLKNKTPEDFSSGVLNFSANSLTSSVDSSNSLKFGAGNGTQTRDLCLGKASLYQLSYSRRCCE